ncbi:hypothetical protein NMG60_11014293 [Bertholletia excelsa]
MRGILHRSLTCTLRSSVLSSPCPLSTLSSTPFCTSQENTTTLAPASQIPPPPPPNPSARPRTRTPLEKQFETWTDKLKPGFTPSDVDEALRSQSDPDLALDIFRWTAQQRGYKHNHLTYLTMIEIAVSGKRFRQAETLIEEVIAGACGPSVPLYNSMIRFCCGQFCNVKREDRLMFHALSWCCILKVKTVTELVLQIFVQTGYDLFMLQDKIGWHEIGFNARSILKESWSLSIWCHGSYDTRH